MILDLKKEDFESIRDIIKDRSGIWLGETKVSFLKLRLTQRLKVTNMETVRDYYYYLKYDSGGLSEIDQLIDAVTVNETYFFREQDQLEGFTNEIVSELFKQKGKPPLSIWSAGCSTGAEPYTLAMLLLEHSSGIDPSRINILASDISKTALQSAREGIYDEYSLRHVPPAYLLKYFDRNSDGKYVIKGQVKEVVQFAHINLMDPLATGRIRNMDSVFCRNVIIYFDDADKTRCIDHLYRSLNRGGYLLLGHSESLGRISGLFEVVRLKRAVVYRKSEM